MQIQILKHSKAKIKHILNKYLQQDSNIPHMIMSQNIRLNSELLKGKRNENTLIIGENMHKSFYNYAIPNILQMTGSYLIIDTYNVMYDATKETLEKNKYKIAITKLDDNFDSIKTILASFFYTKTAIFIETEESPWCYEIINLYMYFIIKILLSICSDQSENEKIIHTHFVFNDLIDLNLMNDFLAVNRLYKNQISYLCTKNDFSFKHPEFYAYFDSILLIDNSSLKLNQFFLDTLIPDATKTYKQYKKRLNFQKCINALQDNECIYHLRGYPYVVDKLFTTEEPSLN